MSDDRHGGMGTFERMRNEGMQNMNRTGVNDFAQGVPSCPFKPAGTWLVVEMEKPGDRLTKSSLLYVPDTAKDAPQVGHVLAVGPGTWVGPRDESEAGFHDMPHTKVGDRILFNKYAGSEIDWPDGRTYLFVKESDIVAYIPED